MRNWRVLTAIAAVVLAALAGVLVWKYTDDTKNDARKPFKFESVLVAKSRVRANTTFERALDTGLIEKTDRVKDSLPSTAIVVPTDGQTAPLKKRFQNLVAGHDLTPGQTVVEEDFVQAGTVASGISGTLSTDEAKVGKNNAQAITIQLDDPHSVGGFLQAGDRVNVIASVDFKGFVGDHEKLISEAGVCTGNSSPCEVKTTAFLIPGAKVLAVGTDAGTTTQAQTTASGSSDTTTPTTAPSSQGSKGMITLEVTPREALQIAHAENFGVQMTLTLMPSTFKAGDFKDDEEVAEAANFFDQPLPLTNHLMDELKAVPTSH